MKKMQRQNFFSLIRVSCVLCLCLLVVMLGGLPKPQAAVQPVSFGTKTDFDTGIFPASVGVGDFNGDGRRDLAVANQFGDTVSILLGAGTGSFGAKTDFATGGDPVSVAVGDFNGDGRLDLAVAIYGGVSRFCWARARAALGSRPPSVRAAVYNQSSRRAISMATVSSIWQ